MADKFKLVAYTGAPIEAGWWGKVCIDLAGIRTDDKLPALREHIRDRAVGVIDSISKTGGALSAAGYFVDTRDGREVKNLLSEGYPYQASVGVFPEEIEEVKQGKSALVNGYSLSGPAVVVRKSHVREISFVSLGADANTSAAIAASAFERRPAEAMPENFDEAVNLMMQNGLDPRGAITAAAEKFPALYQRYCGELRGLFDED
jgi:hypothetical protein